MEKIVQLTSKFIYQILRFYIDLERWDDSCSIIYKFSSSIIEIITTNNNNAICDNILVENFVRNVYIKNCCQVDKDLETASYYHGVQITHHHDWGKQFSP